MPLRHYLEFNSWKAPVYLVNRSCTNSPLLGSCKSNATWKSFFPSSKRTTLVTFSVVLADNHSIYFFHRVYECACFMNCPVDLAIYERDQNSATLCRQCIEMSVSRSGWSRDVVKHLYGRIEACVTVLWLVLKGVCKLCIFIAKIGRSSMVVSRFLLFFFWCRLASNIPFEINVALLMYCLTVTCLYVSNGKWLSLGIMLIVLTVHVSVNRVRTTCTHWALWVIVPA
jgi:hypothetical protein